MAQTDKDCLTLWLQTVCLFVYLEAVSTLQREDAGFTVKLTILQEQSQTRTLSDLGLTLQEVGSQPLNEVPLRAHFTSDL